jgi:hypothetical protein
MSARRFGHAAGFDLPPKLTKLIRDGVAEPHRSDRFLHVVAWLKELGYTLDGMSALLEQSPDGIASKYAGRVCEEVARCFEKIAADDADRAAAADQLAKMNADNCFVLDGAKARILRFEKATHIARAAIRGWCRRSCDRTIFVPFISIRKSTVPMRGTGGCTIPIAANMLASPSSRAAIQLPLAYVAPELTTGRLVTVLADWIQPRVDSFFLYYSSRRQMRPPLKALVDFLREAYRRAPAGQKPTLSVRPNRSP